MLGELVRVVADQVGGFLDLAERLEAGLADLAAPCSAASSLRRSRDQVGGAVEDRRPAPATASPPSSGAAARAAADGVVDVGRGRDGELADDEIDVSIGETVSYVRRRADLSPAITEECAPPSQRGRDLEPAVEPGWSSSSSALSVAYVTRKPAVAILLLVVVVV